MLKILAYFGFDLACGAENFANQTLINKMVGSEG